MTFQKTPLSSDSADSHQVITARLGEQLFGMPIEQVQDVFMVESITRVPGASPEIAGILNLRGRVVTALDLRILLGGATGSDGNQFAIGIEHQSESYCLIVDAVGEVMHVPNSQIKAFPTHGDNSWAALCDRVCELDDTLLVLLDVERVLACGPSEIAA